MTKKLFFNIWHMLVEDIALCTTELSVYLYFQRTNKGTKIQGCSVFAMQHVYSRGTIVERSDCVSSTAYLWSWEGVQMELSNLAA